MSCEQTVLRQRTAIFEKNGVTGAIGLAITSTHNLVSSFDPRNAKQITCKSFETPAEADKWYDEYIIATVTENGWTLLFNGRPNTANLS